MDEPAEHNTPSIPEPPAGDDSTPPSPVITVRPPSPENMWAELVVAVNYLTRLNLSLKEEPKPRLIRKSMAWFPLIGALIGVFGATVDWVMSMISLPGIITATFAVISMLWATRAMHEEEFASLANQYGHTFDKEQKIGWLREERSVRYGTLAVVLVIIMKIGAIASLANNDIVFQGLIAAGCWSRTLMVVTAAWLRPLSGDPVADHFQQPPALRVIVALVLGVIITFIVLGSYGGYALAVGASAGLLVALTGAYYVRGYNGPLLGTLQQIVELSVLGMILAVQ
ncbi:MAG: adenosylcobinamide-GDP ribazoletransferase [Alphaproteobacteria bacterium]|nr:adenosylcobinamide-GDP ribazoletransferase [Alphaproteobacteria bacterium]